MQTKMCKGSILLGLLFLSFISHAQTNQGDYVATTNNLKLPETGLSFVVHVLPENDSSLKVIIHNPEKKKLQLWISHLVLGTMIDTAIDSEEYFCRYHFENADDGRYRIIVKSGKEKFIKEIE